MTRNAVSVVFTLLSVFIQNIVFLVWFMGYKITSIDKYLLNNYDNDVCFMWYKIIQLVKYF